METRVPLLRIVALNFHRERNKSHYASKDLLTERALIYGHGGYERRIGNLGGSPCDKEPSDALARIDNV